MNIYLAAAWSRREEMKRLAAELEQSIPGLLVNSRWIKEEPMIKFRSQRERNAFRRVRAIEDREDVYATDVLVRFSDDLSLKMVPSNLATGARMTEMGLALRGGTPIIVVGGKQCIFDELPEIQHVTNVAGLKRSLRQLITKAHEWRYGY